MRWLPLGLRALPVLLMCLFTGVAWAPRARAGFRLETPPGWIEVRHGLDTSLVRQFIAPDGGALVEFYAMPGSGEALAARADDWERTMVDQGLPYQHRVSERLGVTSDGSPLLVREYEGRSGGANMCVVLGLSDDADGDYVFQGLYTREAETADRPAVLDCLGSLNLDSPDEP